MDARRHIPKMDRLLERPDAKALVARFGQPYVVQTLRRALDEVKTALAEPPGAAAIEELVDGIVAHALENARLFAMQPVINATGVLLHTNLGRAPLGPDLLNDALMLAGRACSLEIDLTSGKRGVRGDYVRAAVARLCGAEDALVVNNNAAALLLILSALAQEREVLVSRGELIQIGGGFRIPEIISEGGAKLREVGTTNITSKADYLSGINENTAAILKVHLSNFSQQGFSARPTTAELAELKSDACLLIEDLGSGNLMGRFAGRTDEDPHPANVLAAGADLVCFSGDKLLGGPQAGLIAGKRKLIERLARFPLMRAIRPDKLTYALLQAVCIRYEKGLGDTLQPWSMLAQSQDELRARAERLRAGLGLSPETHPIIDTQAAFGGGSLPERELPSAALVLASTDVDRLAEAMRRGDPPVLGVIRDGRLLLDVLCIDAAEEAPLIDSLAPLLDR